MVKRKTTSPTTASEETSLTECQIWCTETDRNINTSEFNANNSTRLITLNKFNTSTNINSRNRNRWPTLNSRNRNRWLTLNSRNRWRTPSSRGPTVPMVTKWPPTTPQLIPMLNLQFKGSSSLLLLSGKFVHREEGDPLPPSEAFSGTCLECQAIGHSEEDIEGTPKPQSPNQKQEAREGPK